MNSMTRYYLNNLQDGNKQNAIDLLTGKYVPDRKRESPFVSTEKETYAMLVISFLLMIFYSHAPMHLRFTQFPLLLYVLFWLLLLIVLSKILRVSGKKVTNRPTFYNHN